MLAPLGQINPLLYRLAAQHDPGIIDVHGPGHTFTYGGTTVRGFPAGPGYDLVTGLGTIDAANWFLVSCALPIRAENSTTGQNVIYRKYT